MKHVLIPCQSTFSDTGKVIIWKSIWGITDNAMAMPVTKAMLVLLNEETKMKISVSLADKDVNNEFIGAVIPGAD